MTGRLPYLDYARVFVVYLVIFGHLLPMDNHIPRDFIYAFHMPFFFLVSGMLHKNTGVIQWRKYLRTIGVPLLFFNLLYLFVVNPIFWKYGVFGTSTEGYIELWRQGIARGWNGLLYNGNIPSGVTWFLVALLWCKLLMDFVYCKPRSGIALFIIFFCGTIILKFPSFYFRNAMMVFPFYFMGSYYKAQIESLVYCPKSYSLALLCLFLLIFIVLLNGRVSTKGVGFGHFPYHLNIVLFYIGALAGSLMMLIISTFFKTNQAVTYIATSLITILGMQAVFCDIYRNLFQPDHYEIMIPLAVVIMYACTGIHWFIMRYAPFLLEKRG
ncbi:MAG: acyltransferase family protein [Bacteroidaceae bacterium]|nr:acyltransferase family protein [Bacteroidaceae bacterium]